jgi:hypothetical protein
MFSYIGSIEHYIWKERKRLEKTSIACLSKT